MKKKETIDMVRRHELNKRKALNETKKVEDKFMEKDLAYDKLSNAVKTTTATISAKQSQLLNSEDMLNKQKIRLSHYQDKVDQLREDEKKYQIKLNEIE